MLGGVFAQYVSWRWCFHTDLPINGLSLFLILFIMDVHNPHTGFRDGLAAIDWLETVSVLGVALMLLLGLDFGGVVAPGRARQLSASSHTARRCSLASYTSSANSQSTR